MELPPGTSQQIIRHNHKDWSCRITESNVFGKRRLSLFPTRWRDYGNHYEVSIIGIAPGASLTPNEIIARICDYKQVLKASLISKIELPKKQLFKAKVYTRHYKQNRDILKVASAHRVPVRFICFAEGHETFSVCSRKDRRVSNFFEDLAEIGTFSQLDYCSTPYLGDHLDYYYYCLLSSLGITDKLDIGIFNVVRSLITANGSFSKSCFEPYAKELHISPSSMNRRFWNVFWKVIPTISLMNEFGTIFPPPLPCPYKGKQVSSYVC